MSVMLHREATRKVAGGACERVILWQDIMNLSQMWIVMSHLPKLTNISAVPVGEHGVKILPRKNLMCQVTGGMLGDLWNRAGQRQPQ